MTTSLKIRDLIEAPPVQTVIRLEEGTSRPESIAKSFVFTPEVESHAAVLADALLQDHGRGFFLQGDFGSGKSHFLAALTTWLGDHAGAEWISDRHRGLKRVKETKKRLLPVDISLINYRASRSLEEIVVKSVEAALVSRGSDSSLTPLSAFLTSFKSLLKDESLAADFAEQVGITSGIAEEVPRYITQHPREAYTEGVRFMKRIGMEVPESLVEERYETFARVLEAVKQAGFDGLVLVIDELSEFFRSKPDARSLNEDARTLQLLGELTGTQPIWIIAAVQESIERTGDIAQATFQKIKDRFPIKFVLSTLHIKALISQRLVVHKPGADVEIKGLYDFFCTQYPAFSWGFEDFRDYYPVHPLTIELLDGLGDLFSVHRGIVDFVHSRIAGDPARTIAGILDHPADRLLGPDTIYDHFSSRIAEFSSFNVYTRHVIPHLDNVIEKKLDDPADQDLARRIVRIIVLYTIHPAAAVPDAKLLTELASCSLAGHDPDLNVQYMTEVILDVLVENSNFLARTLTAQGTPVYSIATDQDPVKVLQARIARRASELPSDDTRLLLEALSTLPESISWPGPDLLKYGITWHVNWRQSKRKAYICFLQHHAPDSSVSERKAEMGLQDTIAGMLSHEDIAFALVLSLGKVSFSSEHTVAWEIPLFFADEDLSTLREFLAARLIAADLHPGNPADAPLIQIAEEAIRKLSPAAGDAALRALYTGDFADPSITVEPVIRQLKRFDRLLDSAGEVVLEKRFPRYHEIAPRKVVPTPHFYRQLLDDFVEPGHIGVTTARKQGISDAIEGVATPLGLVELRSGSYIFAPDPEKHPLLSLVFSSMNTAGPTPLSHVMSALKNGPFGLPEDMAFFLLAALANGGLITLLKNNRAVPLEFLHLHTVRDADALAPGEMIGKYDRETLLKECTFLAPKEGWGAFGLRQQREAWQAAGTFKSRMETTIRDVEERLSALAEFSSFKGFDIENLRGLLKNLRAVHDEIKTSYSAREGLERFLKAWRGFGLTPRDIDFITRLRMFLVNQADQLVYVTHYVHHPAVKQAVGDDPDTATARTAVVRLLETPENLVRAESTSVLTDTFEQFRNHYARYYSCKHQEHYQASERKPLSRFSKRAYDLLRRLAAIEVLDRPMGLGNIFHLVEGPNVPACKRNVTEEVMRSPVCACGFVPGAVSKASPVSDVDTLIETSLSEYLAILKAPKVREALSTRLFALGDSAPAAVKRLIGIRQILEDRSASPSALLDLLDDGTAAEISQALSGHIRIEKRDLSDLVSRLSGRRLAPHQVVTAVKEWISPVDGEAVIAIESNDDVAPVAATPVDWWQDLYPLLFKATKSRGEHRNVEAALEARFPAATLREGLSRMSDDELASFVWTEPFHTAAIRQAWLLLAERVLAGIPFQEKISVPSRNEGVRHVDPEIGRTVRDRIEGLNRIIALQNARLPDKLRARLSFAAMATDPWITKELREMVFAGINRLIQSGEEWLATLPPVASLSLAGNPLVMVLDGISCDVWQEIITYPAFSVADISARWFQLAGEPRTATALSELFGFTGDTLDELHARAIPYHQVRGNEQHALKNLLPHFPPQKPVVIRVALIDTDAHAALLRLHEMPAAVGRFLARELPSLLEACAEQQRSLVLTTDHGFSFTPSGLSHGQGGVFERAVFRMIWRGRDKKD